MDDRGGQADWDAERVTLGKHFLRDMEGLWTQVLKQAAVVEEALNTSVRALCDSRADLAANVKGGDQAIDRWEIQIERDCLRVLALHQPVASDLRRIAVVLSDQRRPRADGADLARHIAKRVAKLAGTQTPPTAIPEEVRVDGCRVPGAGPRQPRRSDQGRRRAGPAGSSASDRRIDRHQRLVRKGLKDAIRRDPDRLNTWLRLINTSRNFERIADHATNIAEAVVYLKEGHIVRHSPRTSPADAGLPNAN